jgi:hypothetical protein
MRYSLILLAMTLGAPLTLPLSVSAQAAEEDSLSSWQVDEGASLEQPASEEPALQLELDDAGVGVVPPPPRTLDGYTLEEMELRVKRARIGHRAWRIGWRLCPWFGAVCFRSCR